MNKIAIIGKQNVGKSSLFNCLIKNKISTSIDFPGYTRDRLYKNIKIGSTTYILIDTPGICFQKNKIDILALKQTWKAIKEANIIILLLDAESGLTTLDTSIIKNIKKTKKNIIYVINKIDKLNIYEKYNIKNDFKLKSPIIVSVKLNYGIDEIKNEILLLTDTKNNLKEKNNLKITIIGKSNVGKSSIINKIIKKNRIVTYNEKGTTRDIIYVNTNIKDKNYTLIDTPGIIYKKNKNNLNDLSIQKCTNSIKKSNIVLFIIDVLNGLTKQDLNLIKMSTKLGKPIILIINKSDICNKKTLKMIEDEIKTKLSFAKFISFHFISAKYGFGIKNIINKISILDQFQNEQYSKSYLKKIIYEINIFLKQKKIKMYYCKILNYDPLTINLYYKKNKNLPINYKKYITNYFSNKLNTINIPIKMNFKKIIIN